MVDIVTGSFNLGVITTKGSYLVKELGKATALGNFLEADRPRANGFLKIVPMALRQYIPLH